MLACNTPRLGLLVVRSNQGMFGEGSFSVLAKDEDSGVFVERKICFGGSELA